MEVRRGLSIKVAVHQFGGVRRREGPVNTERAEQETEGWTDRRSTRHVCTGLPAEGRVCIREERGAPPPGLSHRSSWRKS